MAFFSRNIQQETKGIILCDQIVVSIYLEALKCGLQKFKLFYQDV